METITSHLKMLLMVAATAIAMLILIWSGCKRIRDERNFSLIAVPDFGSNPGNLQMFRYVPSTRRTKAPLVVVMHGCTQNAQDFANHSGWPELADKLNFVLVFPQQRSSNNFAKCFRWYSRENSMRGSGEALSIKQMVDRMKADYAIDPSRIYVTGLSAGAAMTTVMLATYPDVFAGGAIMAGVPYGCATTLGESLACMQSSVEKTPVQWGDLVRHAASPRTSWPIVSIWQGTADHVIAPVNAREEMEQWTNVHELSQTPSTTDMVAGFPHQVFRSADGKAVVEVYSITNMGHGQPIYPGTEAGHCGVPGAFFYDVKVCSAYQVAKFWKIER